MNFKKMLLEWKANCPIRKYRKQEKLSQAEFAALIGVSTYTVQRWEDGAINPSEENVIKLEKLISGFSDQWEEWKRNSVSL